MLKSERVRSKNHWTVESLDKVDGDQFKHDMGACFRLLVCILAVAYGFGDIFGDRFKAAKFFYDECEM